MRRVLSCVGVVLLSLAVLGAWSPSQAGLGDLKSKIKKKAEQKVTVKAEEKVDDALDRPDTTAAAPEETEGESEEPAAPAAPAAAGKGGAASSENMALYTKYDFVPGDRVIFFDDLSAEEVGEFPSRWKLDSGVFEVVRKGSRSYVMCTDKGSIRPKIPPGPLPPKYTIEMDFWSEGPEFRGHWYHIYWVGAEDEEIGNVGIQDGVHTNLRILDKDLASKKLAAELAAGLHTMRIMATRTTIKCYIDNERVANVPAVEGFNPVGFRILMDPYQEEADNPMLIGTLRYAEGGKTLREQLNEAGRIVTHGILFDSGSDRIKAESYKTLADIGALLGEDASLRVSIEGHTDGDGTDDSNQKLSQKRAEAVKTYLVETYKIESSRLQSKGWGETKPIDANDTAEGKANNRRVELVKL